MPHGRYIYAKSYYMAKATMCAESQSDHVLPYCKCVFWCCVKCTTINIPDHETDDNYPDSITSISFTVII